MFQIFIDEEEVVCESDFQIKEEFMNLSSVELYKVFPKSWKGTNKLLTDYYYPQDYTRCKIYKDNEYYRVFVGVTINNKAMLESIFNNLGYDYYIKELDKIKNVEEILKYDELLKESNEENKMIIIKNMLESFSYGL